MTCVGFVVFCGGSCKWIGRMSGGGGGGVLRLCVDG